MVRIAVDEAHAARPLVNPGEWITHADYPPQARREELSGTTRVRLDVDEQGVPIRCTLKLTSGSELLDTTACAKLMERARFHPVLNSSGVAAPSVYETSVRWSGSEDAPDPLATTPQPIDTRLWVSLPNLQFDPAIQGDRTAIYDLEVDRTGGVTDCAITQGSGDEQFDKSLCDQLEVNAAFDVSSSGPGHFRNRYTMPERALRSFSPIARSHSRSRNYGITFFIEEDGSVSDCRWIGRNAPALDPWPHCNRSSWVEQRDVNGNLVRGETQLVVSERDLDQLETLRASGDDPANRGLTMVFLEDGSVTDCRWSGANPPAFDPWVACKHIADTLKKETGLAAMLRGRQNFRLDEGEVTALAARAERER